MHRQPTLRGRDLETEALGETLDVARRGTGAVIVLDGAAGFGKSRLIEEAARIAGRLSIAVGSSGAEPGSAVVPMAPILEALFDGERPLLDREDLGDLHELPDQRYWLFQEIQDLLERRAGEMPLLISLDDMHWADRGTIAGVRTLAPSVAGSPIVWLVAYRRNEASLELLRAIDELQALGARTLTLSALSDEAVEAIARDIFGAEPGPTVLEVAKNAHGNPFLLIELLLGLVEEDLITVRDGTVEALEARLPARMRGSMRERLERLSPPARRAATAASVLGRSFTFIALANLLELPPTRLLDSVEELMRADLIVDAGEELRFCHDLIGQAVLDTIPETVRRALDRQAADVLLAAGALPVEIAGRLAASAERGDAAAASTLLKAAQAIGPSDPGTAAELGVKALSLTARHDPRRAELVKETALYLHLAGRAEEARDFADRALGQVLSSAEQAEVRLSIATMFTLTAETRVEASRDALVIADVPEPLRALHLAVLVLNLVAAGSLVEAREFEEKARKLTEATNDDAAALALALSRFGLLEGEGRYERMLEQGSIFRGLGETPEEQTTKSAAEWFRSNALAGLDRIDEALDLIGDGLTAARRDRQAWMVPRWELWRGRLLLQSGQLADAQAALEGVFSARLVEPPLPIEPDAAGLLALSRVATHTANRRLAGQCAEMARETLATGQREGRRQLAWLLALQAMARGDPAAASAELGAPGPDPADPSPLPLLALDNCDFPHLARVAVASADDALAAFAVQACERRRELNPATPSIVASAAHTRGVVSGDVAELERAVAAFESGPRPLARASALEDLGVARGAAGQRDEGIDALGRGLELYVGCGATWDERRVRGRLRELGVRRRVTINERPESGWASLTDSELEVVRLVAEGLTNRQAAERLYVSPHTVSTHLRHAFAKLEINSRVELARIVHEHD